MDCSHTSHGNQSRAEPCAVSLFDVGKATAKDAGGFIASLNSFTYSNMVYKLSYDIKSSALVIALILVPILVLIAVVAIALACSNYWSIHSLKACISGHRKQWRRKKIPSDSENGAALRATETSDIRVEFAHPVTNREHI